MKIHIDYDWKPNEKIYYHWSDGHGRLTHISVATKRRWDKVTHLYEEYQKEIRALYEASK